MFVRISVKIRHTSIGILPHLITELTRNPIRILFAFRHKNVPLIDHLFHLPIYLWNIKQSLHTLEICRYDNVRAYSQTEITRQYCAALKH